MNRKKITDADQLRHIQNIKKIEILGTIGKQFISWGTVGLIFYLFFDAVKAYAGTTSYADVRVVFDLITKLEVKVWLPYAVGGSGFAYGIGERQFRKKKVKYLSERIKKLETGIDPDRSSSGLNHFGETKEGD